MKNFTKTRIAPTPSGFLHLGNILSFAMTAALARKTGASTLLRIDDLDRERVADAYVSDIFDTLRFMGIRWDEGPADAMEFERDWSQVRRMELYRQALEQLRSAGVVFACSCSRAAIGRAAAGQAPKSEGRLRSGGEGRRRSNGAARPSGGCSAGCSERGLSLDASGVSWRFRTDAFAEGLRVKTIDGGMIDAVLPPEMRDFVVLKKDGFPAYQLTSLVDDVHYGVDLIVRGDDLWPSTLAQHSLSYPLGAAVFREIAFYHHGLLLGDGGGKLSKSAGATSIRYLRQSGLEPGAIYSLILRMLGIDQVVGGWEEFAVRLGF